MLFLKEIVILMMVDSVEVVSKSLKEFIVIKIDFFVENIVNS